MLNMFAIMRKELRTYFASPVAYVVIAAFLFISGYLFAILVTAPTGQGEASMAIVFGNVAVILLLIAPALTMRLLAEEQRSGTIELLLTSPVQDWEVVVGKYLASVVLFLVPVAMTVVFPVILFRYGNPDIGPMIGGYVGMVLFGAAFLAIGVLASSLTQNQVIAALVAVAILLALWLLNAFTSAFRPPISDALNYLTIIGHYSDFGRGVIDSKDVIYYLSVIVVALFLGTRALETRRWT